MFQPEVGAGAGGSDGVDAGAAAVPAAAAASADDAPVLSGRDDGPPHVLGFLARRLGRQRRRLHRVMYIYIYNNPFCDIVSA